MLIREYANQAVQTAVYPDGMSPDTIILGLIGETGELSEEFKKMIRNDHGELTPERAASIHEELGDVLWYASIYGRRFDVGSSIWDQTFEEFLSTDPEDEGDINPARAVRLLAAAVGVLAEGDFGMRSRSAQLWSIFRNLGRIALWCGMSLDAVAQANLDKLAKRHAERDAAPKSGVRAPYLDASVPVENIPNAPLAAMMFGPPLRSLPRDTR